MTSFNHEAIVSFLSRLTSCFSGVDIVASDWNPDSIAAVQAFSQAHSNGALLIVAVHPACEGRSSPLTATVPLQDASEPDDDLKRIVFYRIDNGPLEDNTEGLQYQIGACPIQSKTPIADQLKAHIVLMRHRATSLTEFSAKLAELESDLNRTSVNVKIPTTTLELPQWVCDYADANPRATLEAICSAVGDDDRTLNALQKKVAQWRQKIKEFALLDRDPRLGSVSDEVSFWTAVGAAVVRIDRQLQSNIVQLTLGILQEKRRLFVVTGFQDESGFSELKAKTAAYCEFLQELPIKALIYAKNIDELCQAISKIFAHLRVVKRINYPMSRALQLIQTLCRDTAARLHTLAGGIRLFSLPFAEFNAVISSVQSVITLWLAEGASFRDDIREFRLQSCSRQQRSETLLALSDTLKYDDKDLTEFNTRLTEIHTLRQSQNDLWTTLRDTFPDYCIDLESALQTFRGVNVLDLRSLAYSTCATEYWKQIATLESELEQRIQSELDKASNDTEVMFAVCARFKKLLARPKIQAALIPYQECLLSCARQALQALQDRYAFGFDHDNMSRSCRARNVPTIAGIILWIRGIERNMDYWLDRISSVLGTRWAHHVDGVAIKHDCDAFRQRLHKHADTALENWKTESSLVLFSLDSAIFRIPATRKRLIPDVNFSSALFALLKDARALSALELRIPYDIRVRCSEAKSKQPFAVRLDDVLHAYLCLMSRMNQENGSALVLSGLKRKAQTAIRNLTALRWGSSDARLKEAIDCVTDAVAALLSSFEVVSKAESTISCLCRSIAECDGDNVAALMKDIQVQVQSVTQNPNHVNYSQWLTRINNNVQNYLRERFAVLVDKWITEAHHRSALEIKVEIANNVLSFAPALHEVRLLLIQQLENFIWPFASLPKLQIASATQDSNVAVDDVNPIISCLTAFSIWLKTSNDYLSGILAFQSLLDIDEKDLVLKIDDIQSCRSALDSLNADRDRFLSNRCDFHVGSICITSQSIHSHIDDKISTIHRHVTFHLCTLVSQEKLVVYEILSNTRSQLETMTAALHSIPIPELCSALDLLRSVQIHLSAWKKRVILILSCSKFLTSTDVPPSIQTIESSYDAVEQIFQLRLRQLLSVHHLINVNLSSERRALIAATGQLSDEWQQKRPVDGDYPADHAIAVLDLFEKRASTLRRQASSVTQALQFISEVSSDDSARAEVEGSTFHLEMYDCEKILEAIDIDIDDLRSLWSKLSPVWSALHDIGLQKLSHSGQPSTRSALSQLHTTLMAMPNAIRLYDAHTTLVKRIDLLLSMNGAVADLQASGLRPIHHKQLATLLFGDTENVTVWHELTIADIWSCGGHLLKIRNQIHAIVEQAQGENALMRCLEEMEIELRDLRLEFDEDVICNWASVLSVVSDQASNLTSMRSSPYAACVADLLEQRFALLGVINDVLDIWSDVQKRWLSLSGSMKGKNGALMDLNSMYYRQFNSLDSDYRRLLIDARHDGSGCSLLQVGSGAAQLSSKLSSIASRIDQVQAGLGEFLQKQRAGFPRLFFIGDHDLLEMLANPSSPTHSAPFLSKLFSGIVSLIIHDQDCGDCMITGMSSRSGETVLFEDPVVISSKQTKLQSWLKDIENEMRHTLGLMLVRAVGSFPNEISAIKCWISRFPVQIQLLAARVCWTSAVERGLETSDLHSVLAQISQIIAFLTTNVADIGSVNAEALLNELLYQRDIVQQLIHMHEALSSCWIWQSALRSYIISQSGPVILEMRIAGVSIQHGFEYIGIPELLVYTELTMNAFTALAHSLHHGFGGAPFGPAGTGKTETVKALGGLLGRHVIVFNCDENFDIVAMGRILSGLCMSGAWGCFDEFNRLTEFTLSSLSQQIYTIQCALRQRANSVELTTQSKLVSIPLSHHLGLFITLNPSYAGRNALPDNLQHLFRSVPMSQPESIFIAKVTLYSQGFTNSERIASCVVELLSLCRTRLSSQTHYDFGLRSLKSILRSAGHALRKGLSTDEWQIMFDTLHSNLMPRLVASDVPLFILLLQSVSQEAVRYRDNRSGIASDFAKTIVDRLQLTLTSAWLDKLSQLQTLQAYRHGLILVGDAGSGKSTCLRSLLDAQRLSASDVNVLLHVIEPKAISKADLFGSINPITASWTDGVFTSLLRQICNSTHKSERHWIVFDGDIDPKWAENLNSLLDDTKKLCLPNGERLELPDTVRIVFEVSDLTHATPASISRCGMIYFDKSLVSEEMLYRHLIAKHVSNDKLVSLLHSQTELVLTGLKWRQANVCSGIMGTCLQRILLAFISLVQRRCCGLRSKDEEIANQFRNRAMIQSLIWATTCDLSHVEQLDFINYIILHENSFTLRDLWPKVPSEVLYSDLCHSTAIWQFHEVNPPTLSPDDVLSSECFIDSPQTIHYRLFCHAMIQSNRSFIMCGPPGSGKSMLMKSLLSEDAGSTYSCIMLSFSSTTTPKSVIKSLKQHCSMRKFIKDGVNQVELYPKSPATSKLVVFCDEINLPALDEFGSQPTLALLRSIIEHGSFWDNHEGHFVRLSNIVVVGACNPPEDASRNAISPRLLRLTPILYIGMPDAGSLLHIYSCFIRAVLRECPGLLSQNLVVTRAMIDVFSAACEKFSPLAFKYRHYVYSPRDLTRWVRALHFALQQYRRAEIPTWPEFARLWLHEGLRIFADRLVDSLSVEAMTAVLEKAIVDHFDLDNESLRKCLERPVLFSALCSGTYEQVSLESVRELVTSRLPTFREEIADVNLVLFDSLIEHLLRIGRVLVQPFGHLVLCGTSGAGKTLLTRFVSWLLNMNTVQIKLHRGYSIDEFLGDLRRLMLAAVSGPVVFVFDESNVVESGFLELLNELLTSGEIPGLFEGSDFASLMQCCRRVISQSDDPSIRPCDSDDTIYTWFRHRAQRNVHVVFTMNPISDDFFNRSSTSPALFNRCVVDWFGDWSNDALHQIAIQFLHEAGQCADDDDDITVSIAKSLISCHQAAINFSDGLRLNLQNFCYVTPRHFVDFIHTFINIVQERRRNLDYEQGHRHTGLEKLRLTEEAVINMQDSLLQTRQILDQKIQVANMTLEEVLKEQAIVEKKRDEAMAVEAQLRQRRAIIAERQRIIQDDLDVIQPKLDEARNAVQSIRKASLDEIRGFSNPPAAVKLALEPTLLLLGVACKSWTEVRRVLRRADFISSIVNFDPENVTPDARLSIKRDYMAHPEFTFENVNRASVACGPLVSWVKSQIEYSDVLQAVAPMRSQLELLQNDSNELEAKHSQLCASLQEIEGHIGVIKQKYGEMVASIQSLKSEIESVESRCGRSLKIVSGLSSERSRWEASSLKAADASESILGDSILSSAFLVYAGYYDEHHRNDLAQLWHQSCLLPARIELSFSQVMVSSEDLARFSMLGLPVGNNALSNAVLLERSPRYPLVIDPANQAAAFIQSRYPQLTRTRLTSPAFLKTLTSCLRFGTVLLIEDVENIDPILNPVLNREFVRLDGRTVVRVVDRDVDVSPKFDLIMVTRDTNARFTPDLCSRVTFVHFSVTHDTLSDQVLHVIQEVFSPEMHMQRISLQSKAEQTRLGLASLERELLQHLNDSGSVSDIVDDDSLVSKLERASRETQQANQELNEADRLLEQIMAHSKRYAPVIEFVTNVYFLLQRLQTISPLYQFSTQSLFLLLRSFLSSCGNNNQDINSLRRGLARTINDAYIHSIRFIDQNLFSISISLLLDCEHTALFKKTSRVISKSAQHADRAKFLQQDLGLHTETDKLSDMAPIESVVVSSILFPDQVSHFVKRYVQHSLGPSERKPHIPGPRLLLIDALTDIKKLTENEDGRDQIVTISLGSEQSFKSALDAIQSGKRRLLLCNIHLGSITWLTSLESALRDHGHHSASSQHILTAQLNSADRIPVRLIRACKVQIIESAPSTALVSSWNLIPVDRADNQPRTRPRLYFLCAWLYAQLLERLHYEPIGWTRRYSFSTVDLDCALLIIDAFIGKSATVSASQLQAIRALLVQFAFGGQVQERHDRHRLQHLTKQILDDNIFDSDFALLPFESPLNQQLTTCVRHADFNDIIASTMELFDNPSTLGLPRQTSSILLTETGRQFAPQVALMLEDLSVKSSSRVESDSWQTHLADIVQQCLGCIDQYKDCFKTNPVPDVNFTTSTVFSLKSDDLICTFVRQEHSVWRNLISTIIHDLQLVQSTLKSCTTTPSSEIVSLTSILRSNQIPESWLCLYTPSISMLTPLTYVRDVGRRISASLKLTEYSPIQLSEIDIGSSCLDPNRFLSCIKQAIALEQKWALDMMQLQIDLSPNDECCPSGFVATNLILSSAVWDSERQVLSCDGDPVQTEIARARIFWTLSEDRTSAANQLIVPIYTNSKRQGLVAEVQLPCSSSSLSLRGVALLLT